MREIKNIKQRNYVFAIAFCLLSTLTVKINVMAQTVRLKWINFSPYTVTGQNPNSNSPIPTSQIITLLDSLVSRVEGIRIFGTLPPLDSVPYFAKQRGLKVIVGIWLGNENIPAGKAANIAQINSAISIANNGYADKIIVGSEVLYRGDLPADTLIRYIQQVKSACPNIPVSCADVYYSLIANPGVINACDFVSPNIYPFWEGASIECAMQRFHQAYLSLLPFANGKEIFISESGWKTFGNPVGDAVPSLSNAIRYDRSLLAWSRVFNRDVNIFISYDEPWKQPNDDGWGIFNSDAILKPGMDTLFKPFTTIDSAWLCSKLNNSGSDTLYVDYVPLIGSNSSVKGHVDNIAPCDFRIATYIKVGIGWWTKPYFNQPTVPILCDGKWSVNYATGGNDIFAEELCLFTVPAAYSPPLCGGCAIIPQEVYQNAIDWKCIQRATIPATLTASRDTICFGDSVTLIATGGIHYLWSTGDTTASIIVAPYPNTNYNVEISISPGVGTILSKMITVMLLPTINSTPGDQVICSGTAINQINNTDPNNSGTIFSWARNNTTNVTGIGASGTGATITGTLTNTTNIPQTTTFTITATANGCSSTTTSTVTVNPKPSVSSVPASQTICSGTVINQISNTNPNNVAGTTFSWYRDNTINLTGIAASGNGASIIGILTNTTNIPQTTTFTITTTANGCSSTTTSTITVNPKPAISATPASQTICSGTAINQINNSNPNNVAGTTFSWDRNNTIDLTGIAASGNGASITGTLTNTTNTPQTTTFTITATANGCSSTTTSTITVNPKPAISSTPASQTICSGTTINQINNSNPNNVAGTILSWDRDNITNLTGIGGNGTGATITGTLTNTTNIPQTTTFTITASANGCSSTTTSTITVNPKPTVSSTPASQTICSGTAINQINNTNPNNVAGTTFAWTRDNVTNVTGIPVSGTGTTITGTLTNTTNIPQTTTFTVTVTANGCSSTTIATVIVNPKPTVSSGPTSQTICSGTAINQISTNPNNVAGTTFSWTRNNTTNVTGINASGTSATIAGTLTNTTNIPQTITFIITTTANGCASSTTINVTVNPLPTVGLTASALTSLLPDKTTTLTATPGTPTGGTITTSWLYNSNPIVVTGNTYVVNVERVGSYQVLVQETWPGNLVCNNQSPVVTIDAGVSDKLFIFPSPNDGQFTLSYYNAGGASSSRIITVYDSKGAKKYSAKFPVAGPYTLLSVVLRPAQTGIYFVVIGDSVGNKLADGKVMMH